MLKYTSKDNSYKCGLCMCVRAPAHSTYFQHTLFETHEVLMFKSCSTDLT